MAFASMPRSLPGRPPPMPHFEGSQGARDRQSEQFSLGDNINMHSELSARSVASTTSSLATGHCPRNNGLVSNPAGPGASHAQAASPANEIINIFHNARPGVRLTPVSYPPIPNPPPR